MVSQDSKSDLPLVRAHSTASVANVCTEFWPRICVVSFHFFGWTDGRTYPFPYVFFTMILSKLEYIAGPAEAVWRRLCGGRKKCSNLSHRKCK